MNTIPATLESLAYLVEVKILDDELYSDFAPSTVGSAGIDLRAAYDVVIEPEKTAMIPLSIAVNMYGNNLCGLLIPRSGTGSKKGLVLGNSVGLIDSDYQGELTMCALNRNNDQRITVKRGERICQLVLLEVPRVDFQFVDSFSVKTLRGEGGFGSTGAA